MRSLRDGAKWIPGTVIERTGPVSYSVQVSEMEMSLPDVSLPQTSQSESSNDSVSISTNERSNMSESVEKPTAKSPRLPVELK